MSRRPTSPSLERLAAAAPLLAALALAPLGAGCVDGVDGGEVPFVCDGPCDDLSGMSLVVCTERDVVVGTPGCAEASATDVGIDEGFSISAVRFHAVADGFPPAGDRGLRLALYAGEELVRAFELDAVDGSHSVLWDGTDQAGRRATAPFHTVRLEAQVGSQVAASNPHEIATLVSLPENGVGYTHPLGTDRQDTDDWGRVHVVDALVDIGRSWPNEVPVAYLDLSLQNGGQFRPHTFHRHGRCVDIRYLRTDGEGLCDLRWDGPEYDQEATHRLVDDLFAHGAIEVLVDRRAGIEGDGVIVVEDHTNHLHALFGRDGNDTGAGRAVNEGFVGGPCMDDSDCPIRDGFCLLPDGAPAGTCTRECEGRCADWVGGIYTLSECVESASFGTVCMPARDDSRYTDSGCRADLEARSLPSLDHNGDSTPVCVPRGWPL